MLSSVLSLVVITLKRLLGIAFTSMKHEYLRDRKRVALTICVLWLMALGAGSPLLIFRECWVN